jgi:ABC-2 type transport system permease protein
MLIPFRTLLRGALRDRLSLFYATLFPIALLIGLGIAFPSPDYRRSLLAGMLALSTLFFSNTGIAFESLAQRNRGVYKLLRATPYRTLAFVTNLTAARGVIALLSCALVALVGALIFGVPFTWQTALLLAPVLALGTLCFTFLGLTVGNLAQNEGQVAMLNNLVTLPMVFASEAFYSLSGAPDWLQLVSRGLPFGYVIDGVRAAMREDAWGILGPCAIVASFTALTLLLAVVTFRWDPDRAPLRRLHRSARAADMSA